MFKKNGESILKSKGIRDMEGENEVPIKWQDYEINTLVAIRGVIEKISKSTRK